MLLSVHIPKCAGTSFRHVLRKLYGATLWANYGAVFARHQARPEAVPPGTRCIHGHYLADAFDDLYPRATRIVWLRHPVERVVSNYCHFLRSPDMRDDCCRALHEDRLNLREFAELGWMRNESSRYLAYKPVDAFAFVGIVEEFARSLRLFSELFCEGAPLAHFHDNANPSRTSAHYRLSTEERDHILSLNTLDLAQYREAMDRLEPGLPLASTGTLTNQQSSAA